MLLGLLTYKIFENKLLMDKGLKPVVSNKNLDRAEDKISIEQKYQLAALIVLMLFTIPFWICFEQAGSSLTLFAKFQTDRMFLGYEIPVEYFQSLNPLFIITLIGRPRFLMNIIIAYISRFFNYFIYFINS